MRKGQERFEIYLPCCNAVEFAENGAVSYSLLAGSETIMLIEEDDDFRESLTVMLEIFGYKIISCYNDEDAVLKFMELGDAVDIVVANIGSFKSDVETTLANMRSVNVSIGFLFLVESEYNGLAEISFFDAIIKKPFDIDEIVSRIRTVLDGSKVKDLN